MSPQHRFLADYNAIRTDLSGHPHIRVEPIGQLPPETYVVTYKVPGLRLEGDQPVLVEEHRCEIRLPLHYPRQPPYIAALTPVFHPNITTYYCISDFWSPDQPLTAVIRRLGDMLQYKISRAADPLSL